MRSASSRQCHQWCRSTRSDCATQDLHRGRGTRLRRSSGAGRRRGAALRASAAAAEETWALELSSRIVSVLTRGRDGWIEASMDQGPARFGMNVTGELTDRYRRALGLPPQLCALICPCRLSARACRTWSRYTPRVLRLRTSRLRTWRHWRRRLGWLVPIVALRLPERMSSMTAGGSPRVLPRPVAPGRYVDAIFFLAGMLDPVFGWLGERRFQHVPPGNVGLPHASGAISVLAAVAPSLNFMRFSPGRRGQRAGPDPQVRS